MSSLLAKFGMPASGGSSVVVEGTGGVVAQAAPTPQAPQPSYTVPPGARLVPPGNFKPGIFNVGAVINNGRDVVIGVYTDGAYVLLPLPEAPPAPAAQVSGGDNTAPAQPVLSPPPAVAPQAPASSSSLLQAAGGGTSVASPTTASPPSPETDNPAAPEAPKRAPGRPRGSRNRLLIEDKVEEPIEAKALNVGSARGAPMVLTKVKVERITITHGATINVSDRNFARREVQMEASVEGDPDTARKMLSDECKKALLDELAPLLPKVG